MISTDPESIFSILQERINKFHRDFNSGHLLYLHVILKLIRKILLPNDFLH